MNLPASNVNYYAANAPAVPDWFTPSNLPTNSIPPTPDETTLPSEVRAAAVAYRDSSTVPVGPSPQLMVFMALVDTWNAAKAAYAIANTQDKFFQWRWFYARQMVERERKNVM